MTEIEKFLFRHVQRDNAAPFLRSFSFADGAVSIELISFPNRASTAHAIFNNAVMESLWFDEEDPVEWPLDIIGLDCCQAEQQHRFVLNCSNVEWAWRS